MVNGRPCALSIHGTAKYTLSGLPFDDNAVTEAQEMVVQAYGVPVSLILSFSLCRSHSNALCLFVNRLNSMKIVLPSIPIVQDTMVSLLW